jgi:hypothetical protein
MAAEWRIKKKLNELVTGEVSAKDMDSIIGYIADKDDRIRDLNKKVKSLTEPDAPTWSVQQRAQFVNAFMNAKVRDIETLKNALPKHTGLSKMNKNQIHYIARQFIIGPDSFNPHLKSLCVKQKGNSDKPYYSLAKKLDGHRVLTASDLKKYTVDIS